MTRFIYSGGLNSRDINLLCNSLIEKYNNTHYSLVKAARDVSVMMKHSGALINERETLQSTIRDSLASVPRPDSMVITPFMTSDAIVLGGGRYTIASDGVPIDNKFGSIAKTIIHSEERMSDRLLVESGDTVHTVSRNDAWLNNKPWIAECDSDINVTVYLHQYTTQYLNNIRIIPTAGSYIKRFEYSFAPESPSTWTTLFIDTSRRIYDLYLSNIRATAVRVKISGYDAIKGIDAFSVKHIGQTLTSDFIITPLPMPIVRSIEYYKYDVVGQTVTLVSATASADVMKSTIRVTMPESTMALHKIIIRR